MSHSKKSRKTGPIGVSKSSAKQMDPKQSKRKKSSGKASGNRNSAHLNQGPEQLVGKVQKDRRLGSKKKIRLQMEVKCHTPDASRKTSKPKFSSPKEELDFIENDTHFHALLDKQELNQTITEEEANYIEQCLQRYAILCELLGIESGEVEETAAFQDQSDIHAEDDLLERLENPKFRQY